MVPVLVASLSGGCGGRFASLEQPEVYVIDVLPAAGESGLFDQRLKVDLRIRDPNNQDLNIYGLDFFQDVNGDWLARRTQP